MTTVLCVHFLLQVRAFAVAWCGKEFADPHGERVTGEAARVTCKACRRLAKLEQKAGQG